MTRFWLAACLFMAGCAPMRPLVKAASDGDEAKVQQLLKAEPKPDSDTKQYAFLVAIAQGQDAVAQALLAAGADLQKRRAGTYATKSYGGYPCDCNALDLAALAGTLDMVKFLVSRGADVNAAGSVPALAYAAGRGYVEIMTFLMAKGAKPNGASPDGQTPLIWASSIQGSVTAVTLLLKHGAKIDHKSENGLTPLMSAVTAGRTDLIKVLLQHGAVDQGQEGQKLAEQMGRHDVAEALRQGPDIAADAPAQCELVSELEEGREAEDAAFQGALKTKHVPEELSEEAHRFDVQARAAVKGADFKDAAKRYAQGLKAEPLWAQGRYNYALILAKLSCPEEAIRQMKRYLLIAPRAPDARKAKDKIYEWEAKVEQ